MSQENKGVECLMFMKAEVRRKDLMSKNDVQTVQLSTYWALFKVWTPVLVRLRMWLFFTNFLQTLIATFSTMVTRDAEGPTCAYDVN